MNNEHESQRTRLRRIHGVYVPADDEYLRKVASGQYMSCPECGVLVRKDVGVFAATGERLNEQSKTGPFMGYLTVVKCTTCYCCFMWTI
jgi:hypothetical protein